MPMRQTKHSLKLFNTMTRKLEPFTPSGNKRVKMYTCGPSIYMLPHIGNHRTFIFEDLLQRYLEYSGYNVTRLITVTDIEDKAMAEADVERISWKKLTESNTEKFLQDLKLLKIVFPTYVAKSSTSIDQAGTIIRALLTKGYAYWHKHERRRNVYYDPLKFGHFGKLARLDMNKWPTRKRRFHMDTYPGTPWNRGDFILWHGYRPGDKVLWNTKIGEGRPSWNVQDAAMITKHLGPRVDIACGAVDNLVRHHDYTIAVAESFTGKRLARYWLHAKHLLVNGKKMSKSKGNIIYPEDLIRKGYTTSHVRFALMSKHYRESLNFTIERLEKISRKLDAFRGTVNSIRNAKTATTPSKEAGILAREIITKFEMYMNHDLDVNTAFEAIFRIVSRLGRLAQHGRLSPKDSSLAIAYLRRIDEVLQVIF